MVSNWSQPIGAIWGTCKSLGNEDSLISLEFFYYLFLRSRCYKEENIALI
jgi:hypothetical protein